MSDTITKHRWWPLGVGVCDGECSQSFVSATLPALGGKARGDRLDRVRSSAQFREGKFQNAVETVMMGASSAGAMGKEYWNAAGVQKEPKAPPPIVKPSTASLEAAGRPLRLTWMGHSSTLVELDGTLILTDPVWGRRVSPLSFAGPARFHEVPIELEDLPALDAVIISHDHYDHLCHSSVLRLNQLGVRFITSLGVGAHLEAWGVPEERITELDWWESTKVGNVEVTAAPARHFSGRSGIDQFATLWSSWALKGPTRSVWFSGDTGRWDEGFTEIGERLGPFDATMIEIGAFHELWGNIHLGPVNAARVHQQVCGRTMVPVHWGTFNLAMHAWDEPIVTLQELAPREEIVLAARLAGESWVPAEAGVADFWQERRERALHAKAK